MRHSFSLLIILCISRAFVRSLAVAPWQCRTNNSKCMSSIPCEFKNTVRHTVQLGLDDTKSRRSRHVKRSEENTFTSYTRLRTFLPRPTTYGNPLFWRKALLYHAQVPVVELSLIVNEILKRDPPPAAFSVPQPQHVKDWEHVLSESQLTASNVNGMADEMHKVLKSLSTPSKDANTHA